MVELVYKKAFKAMLYLSVCRELKLNEDIVISIARGAEILPSLIKSYFVLLSIHSVCIPFIRMSFDASLIDLLSVL